MSLAFHIEEIARGAPDLPRLRYEYVTPGHYRARAESSTDGWTVRFHYEGFAAPVTKASESALFEPFVPEARVFVARAHPGGPALGWLETGYEDWTRRLRVWELLVDPAHRRRGTGRALLAKAREVARGRGARMLVLETQSCNVPAIALYRSLGFDWIGCDLAHYTADDVARGEVRVELGLPLA